MDVLLTHDGPTDAVRPNSGSEEIEAIIRGAKPSFAFFGHYGGTGDRVWGDFGSTEVYHMSGMELRRRNQYPEEGCMGILHWSSHQGHFEYVDANWLMSFPKNEWIHWS